MKQRGEQLTLPLSSNLKVLHLDIALERDVVPKVPSEVLVQCGPVNLLVVEGLASVVEHALHQQTQQIDTDKDADEHGADEQPPGQGQAEAPLLAAPLDDGGTEEQRGDAADREVGDDERGGDGGAPLEQLLALGHGGEPADRLEHGDDAGEVPERGDVDVDPEEDEDDDDKEEDEGEGGRGGLGGAVGDEDDDGRRTARAKTRW